MPGSPPAVGHADSIASQESDSTKQSDKKKSRRPANTAFRQQRLKAWQPILTPKTVLPLFFVVGIIFAPIGGALYYASTLVQMISIDYTNCGKDAPLSNDINDAKLVPDDLIQKQFKVSDYAGLNPPMWRRSSRLVNYDNNSVSTMTCHLQIPIPEDMRPPVLMYYTITNFYQNHRRYVNSYFDKQLKGTVVDGGAVNGSTCTPLTHGPDGRPYYPCGLIANSIFNDTITEPLLAGASNRTYAMSNNSGIAWPSDKDLYGNFPFPQMNYTDVVPPPNWRDQYPNGYTATRPPPNLNTWEGFQVWMRTAGLPNFSKLYRRNDIDVMSKGVYLVDIDLNWPVTEFRGTKSLLITTKTVIGGKNPFLGIAYIVVGGICIILGFIFTASHLIKPRKLGDHTYLSWNNTPAPKKGPAANGGPSTATASGRDYGGRADA